MTSTVNAGVRVLLMLSALAGGAASAQVPARSTAARPAAVVGAASAGRVTTITQVTVTDVRASSVDGAEIDPATLAAIRRDLGSVGAGWIATLDGKAFTAVTARTAQDVTLRTTLVLAPVGSLSATRRSTRTVGPDGLSGRAQVEGDVLPHGWPLDAWLLDRAWSGTEPGQDDLVDASALFELLLRTLAGPQTREALRQNMQVTPLPVTTTSTPATVDGLGQVHTALERAYGPWTLTTGGRGTLPRVTFTLGGAAGPAQGSATVTVRRDGLPGPLSGVTVLPVQVTLVSRGVRVTLTVTIEQRTAFTPA